MSSRRRGRPENSLAKEREFDQLLRQAARILKNKLGRQKNRERRLLTTTGKKRKKRASAA